MTQKIKATQFVDPGHSWLGVKRELLRELGILDQVSRFSFQKGQTVYLEEDCDASLLANAIKVKYDKKLRDFFEINQSHADTYSPVRYYQRFSK